MQARVLQKTRAYSRRKEKKRMLSTIEAINSAVNNFIWGVPAMICIIGVGLVLSFHPVLTDPQVPIRDESDLRPHV